MLRVVTRPSPQTERVVAVVELLMSRPTEGLTLSEISRRLRVNTPSCHFMLTALTGHGWLVRHPTRKTYRLGPALVAAGKAAGVGFPGAEYAHPKMVELAESLGVSCLAFAVLDDQLTLVDQVWDPHSAARILHVGYRLPLRAPTGAVFLAWSAPDAVERWLGSHDQVSGPAGTAGGADGPAGGAGSAAVGPAGTAGGGGGMAGGVGGTAIGPAGTAGGGGGSAGGAGGTAIGPAGTAGGGGGSAGGADGPAGGVGGAAVGPAGTAGGGGGSAGGVGSAAVGPAGGTDGVAREEADGGRKARSRRTLAFVRTRGYGVELLPDQLGGAVREAVDRGGTRAAEAVLREFVRGMETVSGDLDPDGRYEVSSISAPVFGVGGEVVLALAATGWRERLPGATVERLGGVVRRAADDVSAALGGRPPASLVRADGAI